MASSLGEDADYIGAQLLAIETLDRVGRVQLGPVLRRERHVSEHVGLGLGGAIIHAKNLAPAVFC
jgi:hypothetical protein